MTTYGTRSSRLDRAFALSQVGYAGSGARSVAARSSQPWCCARKSKKEITVGSVVKKRRKRMAKKKHRKLLRKTRVQRRNKK